MGRFDALTHLDQIKEKAPPSSPTLVKNSQKSEKASQQSVPPASAPRTAQKSAAVANDVTVKRTFIKRTFDLYEDQLTYLTRESLQDRLNGKEGSMNAMVREAIDEWIKKHKVNKRL